MFLFHGLLNLPKNAVKKITPFSMTLSIIIAIGLVLWMLYGYLSVRSVEKPTYTFIEAKAGGAVSNSSNIELRQYSTMLVAETVVDGPYDEAVNNGFRNIANYIFGNNTSSASIGMTSPVLQEPSSQKIAMTTPVLQEQNQNETYTISFIMPSKYTMDSIPKPNKSNVQLREVQDRTLASISFSGLWTDTKAEKFRKKLVSALTADGYQFEPNPQFARYNPPWTPPWMRRNEIWIVVTTQNSQ